MVEGVEETEKITHRPKPLEKYRVETIRTGRVASDLIRQSAWTTSVQATTPFISQASKIN
jgi:hypothetical protein